MSCGCFSFKPSRSAYHPKASAKHLPTRCRRRARSDGKASRAKTRARIIARFCRHNRPIRRTVAPNAAAHAKNPNIIRWETYTQWMSIAFEIRYLLNVRSITVFPQIIHSIKFCLFSFLSNRNQTYWNHRRCIVAVIWVIRSATTKICGPQTIWMVAHRWPKVHWCQASGRMAAIRSDQMWFQKLVCILSILIPHALRALPTIISCPFILCLQQL